MKRSEQATKVLKLLEQGKIFEAKLEIICLGGLLKLDENCAEFTKNVNEQLNAFQKKLDQTTKLVLKN